MEVTDTIEIEVTEQSQISDARRRISKMSAEFGLDEKAQDRIALVVTELGTNLIKHSQQGGKFLVQGLKNNNMQGVEIFSVDSGPGMNTSDCLVDGFSTTKTFGNGLGAAQRVSDEFDIFSKLGSGSVIKVRFWNSTGEVAGSNLGGVSIPKKNELLSGDKWFVHMNGNGFMCILVDGLGHGFEACEASKLAIKRFKENLNLPPRECLKVVHSSLRGSRGAVGAIAKVVSESGNLDYCGLGNIAGTVFTGHERKHLTSMNGTLGYEGRKFLEFSVPWTKSSILLMHSDGIASQATADLGSVSERSASLIAAWTYQKYGKKIDDATVLVVKGAQL